MNQFLSNKIIAGIVALALLVGVGVLVSSGDTSSTTRNAALVVATPCPKPGQVTKVSKQSVVCATTNAGSLWYATMKAKGKAQACKSPGAIREKSNIVWVCGVIKKKKLWQATQPLPPAVASTTVIEPGATQPTPLVPIVADNTVLADPQIPDDKIVTQVIEDVTTTSTPKSTSTNPRYTPKSTTTTTIPTTTTTTTIPTTTTSTTSTTTTTTIPRTYQVGETGPGGGIVFYDAGAKQSWGRYLEAAPTDYQVNGSDANVYWGCQGTLTGATATAIGAGKDNTTKILLKCTTAGIAADVANEYSTTTAGAGQWFLPSLDELNELCKYVRQTSQATGGGTVCRGGMLRLGFAYGDYWSSSECSEDCDGAEGAWSMYFGNGHGGGSHGDLQNQLALDKATPDAHSSPPYVRPVRAF